MVDIATAGLEGAPRTPVTAGLEEPPRTQGADERVGVVEIVWGWLHSR